MPRAEAASYFVIVITAGVLFYVSLRDLRDFKIRNELVFVLAGLFFLHALLSGRWIHIHWNLAFAAITFALMLLAYAQGLMGGGDLKLMTVALLWTGPQCAALFLLIVVVAALVHTGIAKV